MSGRAEKAVEIGKNIFVTVYEIDVQTVRALVSGLDDIEQVTLKELLTSRFDDFLLLAEGSLTLPEGMEFGKLTISQLRKIWNKFKEINPDFFQLAGSLIPIMDLLSKLPTLTEPVADSLNGDTSMSGLMDGLFSSELTNGSEK